MQDLGNARIERFILERELGQGGMARVYLATDTVLQRQIALKVLTPEMGTDAGNVARFLREARASSRLDHPNIVPVQDTGEANGYHYIAMQYVEGRSLRQCLGDGPLAPKEASAIVSQVAAALDCAHEHGVMHRDIKPENILIDASGAALLTDFGIASAADEMSVTVTGNVVGTPVYMSPEQLRGEPATPRAEIYSLGILAYELLTGTTPFAGRPAYAIMLAHLNETPQQVSGSRPDLPAAVSMTVDRALSKDPGERFSSAGEFAEQFTRALAAAPDVTAAARPPVAVAAGGAATVVSARASLPGIGRKRPGWPVYTGIGLMVCALMLGVNGLVGGSSGAEDQPSRGLDAPGTPVSASSPTPPVEATPTSQPEEPAGEQVVPVLFQEQQVEPEPAVQEPVVEAAEPDVSVQDPPQAPPADPPGHSGEHPSKPEKPEKPEKEPEEKQNNGNDNPGRPDNPGQGAGNSDQSPGNSGNAPGNKKRR
jgi:eukaryotic-like serine/threonine-protein kinase